MRYVILNKNIGEKEKRSRKEYIEKVTNLYFISYETEDGVEYKSIPSSINDCLFVVGHNMDVKEYLSKNTILEKNVVIVSCKFGFNTKFKKKKNIYISYNEEGITNFYDGVEWNLHFLVSKEELKLINSNGEFIDRVKKYFRREK